MNRSQQTAFPIRGLMLDAARLPEPLAFYKKFIDFCADWDVNTIIFRLTDDQGCAIRFTGCPKLLTHKNALTPDDIRSLVSHAQNRNIVLIPEIESFGHCRYITGTETFAHLSDKAPGDPDWREGLIPTHPEVMDIFVNLYAEIADLFPGPYLHGGCDEVTWGASDFSKDLLAKAGRADICAAHLNGLNRIARDNHKEFIVWADMVCRNMPECMDRLDKNIILHDWIYKEQEPEHLKKTALKILSRGFRLLGGPALIWARWGPRAGQSQLRNIDAFCSAYRGLNNKNILGIVTTHWIPTRFLPGADLDSLAYAAVAMAQEVQRARTSAFADFVTRHFEATWDSIWADIFRTLYDTAPLRLSNAPPWSDPVIPDLWTDEPGLRSALKENEIFPLPFDRLIRQMSEKAETITRNQSDFQAMRVSVEYLDHLQQRRNITSSLCRKTPDQAARDIASIADSDQAMLKKVLKIWDAQRFPWAADQTPETGHDDLAGTLSKAASFSKELADNPDMFRTIFDTIRRENR